MIQLGRGIHRRAGTVEGDTGGGRGLVIPPNLYKLLFRFKALYCVSPSSCYAPSFLQRLTYCNTIARLLRNIRLSTDPPVVCHTPYNIGDDNIVQRRRYRREGW